MDGPVNTGDSTQALSLNMVQFFEVIAIEREMIGSKNWAECESYSLTRIAVKATLTTAYGV